MSSGQWESVSSLQCRINQMLHLGMAGVPLVPNASGKAPSAGQVVIHQCHTAHMSPWDSHSAGQCGITVSMAKTPAALARAGSQPTAAHLQYAEPKVLTAFMQSGRRNMYIMDSGRGCRFFHSGITTCRTYKLQHFSAHYASHSFSPKMKPQKS